MSMQHCIDDIRPWKLTDRLKLNVDKTEYLLIGTRLQLCKISTGSLAVGYHRITSAQGAKNLGCWFDQQRMGRQIYKICNSSYFHLHNIKCITTKSMKRFVQPLVISRIDYCNSLLYGLAHTLLYGLTQVSYSVSKHSRAPSLQCLLL